MSTNSKIKINLDSLKSRREWKRHKVKDGHNIFRILPPFGENSNGYPYRKWQIIWGLTDPETGRMRPFASSMTSEKRCPVVEFVAALKKKSETMKAQLQTAGTPEDEIKSRMKDLNELISNLSPKTVYIYNAADKSGEVGLLELKSTAHKKMKALMNQYVHDYNQDPTSLNSADDDSGIWFDITRQGLGRETEYDVVKCQTRTKTPQGIMFVDDRSPLPDSVVENYDNLAYDLSSVYQVKSYEDLEEILSANMANIIAAVPDADLVDRAFETQVLKSAPAKATKPTGSKPVTLKLDDADEDDVDATEVVQTVAKTVSSRTAPKTVAADDDFLAAADALLKG